MQKNHKFFSNLALNLAEKHLGQTNINPTVGCIIEKNNSVISAGLTSISGRPHAEFNALNKKLNFKGSNMYVTLEPCAHYGLTPPCTNIIQNKKIKNVYYIYDDPNPITAGKAKWLRNLVSENNISCNDLVLPIFVREGKNIIEPIKDMPGVKRYSIDKLPKILNQINKFKIPMIAIFPYIQNSLKDNLGSEALNPNNLVCKSLRLIKKKFPNIGVMCDVALDPPTKIWKDQPIK